MNDTVRKLARGAGILVLFVLLSAAVYFSRQLMASYLVAHSWEHYLVRAAVGFTGLIVTTLLIQNITARSPVEVSSDYTFPSVPFKWSNLAKRVVDLLLSIALLVVLSPVLIIVTVLIFILEGSPAFYISQRYISVGHCVSVLKFRTMVRDARSPKYRLRERFMRNGFLDIPLDCEVYTPFGRLLERTQMVETLQLFNILLHRMSLIGNRPLPLDNIELLEQFKGWHGRFASPAGITGLSQVVGKLNQSPEDRLSLESRYSALYRNPKANIFRCDLYIAFYTLRLVLTGKALSGTEADRILRISGSPECDRNI